MVDILIKPTIVFIIQHSSLLVVAFLKEARKGLPFKKFGKYMSERTFWLYMLQKCI
jgi:hypothetical protein